MTWENISVLNVNVQHGVVFRAWMVQRRSQDQCHRDFGNAMMALVRVNVG